MQEINQRSRDKYQVQTSKDCWYVEVRNFPTTMRKDDVVYFIWKSMQRTQGLIRNSSPIIKLTQLPNEQGLQLLFRSQQQACFCLQMNQLFLNNRVLFISSKHLTANKMKNEHLSRLRFLKEEVEDKFRQIYVGNLPYMTKIELINYFCELGQLKSFIDDTKDNSSSVCYCEYSSDDQTEMVLKKLDNSKLKGRSVIAKRAALMKGRDSTKTKISTTKNTRTQSLNEMYMTFNVDGFFKNKKISCVLQLKNVLPEGSNVEVTLKDIRTQCEKIGPLIRTTHKNLNVYIEYERVEYSQIAYLLISKRKYDNKQIQVLFYDPIKFADDILV